jgi:DNA-binding NarL/FixJ family response regulator
MVTGTAAANGGEVAVAENLTEAETLCRELPIAFVIIDLSVSEPDIATIMTRLRAAAGPVPAIAFGSHVDKERLDEARAAGCDEVMPRSRFSSELPALLRRYAGGSRDR